MVNLKNIYKNTPAIFLAHGYVGEILGKTINGVIMHSRLFDVVALVDKYKAGQDTSKICPGVRKKVHIVKTLEKGLEYNPGVVILMDDPGEENFEDIKLCINNGKDIINSSFIFLNDFPELVSLAKEKAVRLIDLRKIECKGRHADGSILNIKAKVVYVMGTDCGLGKRTAAYELVEEARKRGIKTAFAATGQTGLMIGCDSGVIVDALPNNIAPGEIEKMIVELDKKGFDLIFVEGQASIMHYSGSGSIVILHVSNPHAIILVHNPGRKMHVEMGDSPIYKMCDLEREISIIENLSLPGGNNFKVVALATIGEKNINYLKKTTNYSVADVRQDDGPAILLDEIVKYLQKKYKWKPQGGLNVS